MLNSMTGFGRAEGIERDLGVMLHFEISSVNRKQFDVKFALPKELTIYEGVLRSRISQRISRGSLMVRAEMCFLENAQPSSRIDHAFLANLITEATDIALDNEIEAGLTIGGLLTVPGVVVPAPQVTAKPEFESFLFRVFDETIEHHIQMRRTEGANLEKDILARIERFESIVSQIAGYVVNLPEQQAARLRERLQNAGFSNEADDERLLKEFVFFADKLDVSEELTRLNSHFAHFRELVAKSDAAGRSLDFLIQEMFREINTLGNKAASPDVSPLVVELKTGLEQVREQVQNIE